MCKLTFLFWWSHKIKNSTQFGAIFHLNINRTLFQKPVTSITLWPARCITSSPISEEKKPAVRLNLIIGSCNVVFTPPLFQCALQYLPLQLLTNKSENAWLLHINMEMHLFKEKRRETFHQQQEMILLLYDFTLMYHISVFKINTGNTWHK